MADEPKVVSEMPAATKPTVGEMPAADTDAEAFDEARAKALIAKLRGEVKEASKAQKRLADLEAAEAKRAEADLSAAQLADKRLAELQAKLTAAETAAAAREQTAQRERAEHAVALKAQSLGLPVKAVLKLIEWEKLTYDAAGQPENVDKLVAAVAQEYPLLAQAASGAPFGTPAGRLRLAQPLPTPTPRKVIPL